MGYSLLARVTQPPSSGDTTSKLGWHGIQARVTQSPSSDTGSTLGWHGIQARVTQVPSSDHTTSSSGVTGSKLGSHNLKIGWHRFQTRVPSSGNTTSSSGDTVSKLGWHSPKLGWHHLYPVPQKKKVRKQCVSRQNLDLRSWRNLRMPIWFYLILEVLSFGGNSCDFQKVRPNRHQSIFGQFLKGYPFDLRSEWTLKISSKWAVLLVKGFSNGSNFWQRIMDSAKFWGKVDFARKVLKKVLFLGSEDKKVWNFELFMTANLRKVFWFHEIKRDSG